jgi:short-subunit dehydrogenase
MPTALITGASSGIGLELARLFARDGYQLIMVARDTPRLAQAQAEVAALGGSVISLPQDLAQPGAAAEIGRALARQLVDVDVLVNNAGFGVFGPFGRTELAAERELLLVNVVALTELTKLMLSGMLERRRGRILNVASTASFLPGPYMACYYASKAYVLSFSEAVANELRGSGVSVTALCPGPTATDFHRRAGMERTRLMNGRMTMGAEDVARAGYRGLMSGKAVVIPGFWNRFLALLVRLLPREMVTQTVRRIQEQRR